ncbi:MAG: ATP-binding protein [Planctomycetota bacterium]|nr:ATP-binding protein [Planctomycetota bacterium]
MNVIWWILLGLLIGLIGMLPIVRLLLRRAEYRARQAERRARQAERLAELGAMTGGLAHEIKNPLSTIGLNAQLLGEDLADADLPDDERQRLKRRLDALTREVERLRGILTDFLQFAGRMKLDPRPHDLVRLVDELSDFFHPQCDQAGIMLRTQLPAEPVMAEVDEAVLKQAILNLMINAVQAMKPPEGGEGGEHRRCGDLMLRLERGRDEVRLHVIDTGPGIEPGKLEEIFHPYVSHKTGGTGLGLPTARRIVEEHGGRLDAHSEPGRGSDFVVHLPLAPDPRPPEGEADSAGASPGA